MEPTAIFLPPCFFCSHAGAWEPYKITRVNDIET